VKDLPFTPSVTHDHLNTSTMTEYKKSKLACKRHWCITLRLLTFNQFSANHHFSCKISTTI